MGKPRSNLVKGPVQEHTTWEQHQAPHLPLVSLPSIYCPPAANAIRLLTATLRLTSGGTSSRSPSLAS